MSSPSLERLSAAIDELEAFGDLEAGHESPGRSVPYQAPRNSAPHVVAQGLDA
jgi:hypothetical protein